MIRPAAAFLFWVLPIISLFSQKSQDYYLSINPGFSLGDIQKTARGDGTYAITTEQEGFSAFLNTLSVYGFEKAFPTAVMEKNQRVYRITLDEHAALDDFYGRDEIGYIESAEREPEVLHTPDDYDYLDRGGPNTALELMRAPLAWSITKSDPDVVIGIQDIAFNLLHKEISNKIVYKLYAYQSNGNNPHGTIVASVAGAETNNGSGIASIGYHSSLALIGGHSVYYTLLLSQQPGVRVINISLNFGCNFSQTEANIFEEIWTGSDKYPPVVIVAAAGNGSCSDAQGGKNGYVYPSSYDHVISVSEVGHLVPRGTEDMYLDYGMFWEDVHRRNINNPKSTTTHNDKVELVAPGNEVLAASTGTNGYIRTRGTSIASPMVTGVVALMFAANPDLTADQVREILKNTADDIYHIPENTPYTGLLGAGRVNAYRAVLTAKCMAEPMPGVDLMVRNSPKDYGDEPDGNTQQVFWNSQDIWVRNQNDGREIRVHQNPKYDPGKPNYVYVRVTNRSCETSSGKENLMLYWAKANTSLAWPSHWDGSLVFNGVPTGGEFGWQTIPPLAPGQDIILEFPWMVPNPALYTNIFAEIWHFCLLARIVNEDDPMAVAEGASMWDNVKNNNNIAWKNTTVIAPRPPASPPGSGAVLVGNPSNRKKTFRLEFQQSGDDGSENGVGEGPQISLEMDDAIYGAWERGKKAGRHFRETEEEKTIAVTGNKLLLDNISLEPDEYGIVRAAFHFKQQEGRDYTYHLIQTDIATGEIVGGETFEIRKDVQGYAGNRKQLEENQLSPLIAANRVFANAQYPSRIELPLGEKPNAAWERLEASSPLRIFPNPFHSQFTLEGGIPGRVSLYDTNGRLIGEWEAAADSLTIETGLLPAGVYALRVVGREGIFWERVLVR